MRNKILWSDDTKIELFGLHAKCHICRKPGTTHHLDNYHPNGEVWWQQHAVWMFFSGRELGD